MELSHALNNAQKLIYIIGWSVKVDITLIRTNQEQETLGDLLKRKAQEGVRVLILLWDEALSGDLYPPGMMGTHGEHTFHYFKGSHVKVHKSFRNKSRGKFVDELYVTTIFSHHQKCVIVDVSQEDDSRRKLIAFQGGIDVTDG